ncbi:MAG: tyrosine-type recombinase/integrase [Leptothrix sp. (in: b-proteobacteria)]
MRIYPRGKRGTQWLDVTIAGERITRSLGTSDPHAAQEYAAAIVTSIWRTKRLGETPVITWGTAVLDWLQEHGHERKSIETIKDRLRWLTEQLHDAPLQDITRNRIEKLIDAKLDPRTKKPAKPGTQNRYVAEVSKILNHAHTKGWLAAVPALRHYEEPTKAIRWLTPAQAERLIEELPLHLADMARFSLATGLRESNVRLLRWDQLDLARAIAWVEASEAKAGKPIAVPLNDDALAVLQAQRGRHAKYVFVFTAPKKEGKGKTGPVVNCSSKAWYKATARVGLAGFRWHDLRHTWASWHVQRGTPLPVLQQLGGWSDYTMVLRYAHLGLDHTAAWASNSTLRDKSATSAPVAGAAETEKNALESMGWMMGLEPTTTGITKPSPPLKGANVLDLLARRKPKAA